MEAWEHTRVDICNSVSTQLCKSVQKVSQLVLMYCEHATYGDRRVQNIYLEPPPTPCWNKQDFYCVLIKQESMCLKNGANVSVPVQRFNFSYHTPKYAFFKSQWTIAHVQCLQRESSQLSPSCSNVYICTFHFWWDILNSSTTF